MSALEKTLHKFHIYERSVANKTIYRCTHPRCPHYTQRHLLVGKEAECPKCHNTFYLTWAQLRNKTPVCDFCTKSPKAAALKAARDAAFQTLNDLPDELKEILIDKTLE